jgi:uncharacterized RDD family membrane protein YckC
MEYLDQPTSAGANLTAASDGNRIVAYLIDVLVAGAASFIPYIGWVLSIGYWLTRDALPFLDGQSIGKKAMKIRAVTENGVALTNNWNASVIRNIALIIPIFPLIELIVMLTNPRKQRLGDQWAKTLVVAEEERIL